jgi:hypothetical protein
MSALTASLAANRGAVIAILLSLAAGVGIAVYNNRDGSGQGPGNSIAGSVRNGVQQGVNGMTAVGDTIASLFDSRSPGERASGALASLKHKRQPVLHQRALPKVRRPVSPLAGIVGAVPVPPPVEAPIIPAPLDKVVNGAPVGPVAITPPGGIGGGGPGGFPGVSIPGGGGGIIIPPPAITPPVTPPITPPVTPPVIPPVTSGVPEPSTWAMMLLGFGLIAQWTRRERRRAVAA